MSLLQSVTTHKTVLMDQVRADGAVAGNRKRTGYERISGYRAMHRAAQEFTKGLSGISQAVE
jgi:hypothetical protein